MNKIEVKQLIDRLADKTLSFGCRVLIKDWDYPIIINELDSWDLYCPLEKDVEIKYHKTVEGERFPIDKILGHEVFIGDVLEKLLEVHIQNTWKGNVLSYNDQRGNQVIGGSTQEIIDVWGKCGFKKSLNKIMEEPGFTIFNFDKKGFFVNGFGEPVEQLIDPNARALFEYLNKIKL